MSVSCVRRVNATIKRTIAMLRMAQVEAKPIGDTADMVTVIEAALAELKMARRLLRAEN
jgi:hypothetical protein